MTLKNFATIIAVSILISSCNNDDYKFLYNNFSSLNSPVQQESGSETGNSGRPELKLRIDANNIYFGEASYKYKIVDANEEYVILESSAGKNNDNPIPRLKYNRIKKELLILDNEQYKNNIFMTRNDLMEQKLNSFASVPLTADISHLSNNQKEMLKILFRIADIMDDIFWVEAYGDRNSLMETAETDLLKSLYKINYGPWERLNNNKALISRFDSKPAGANLYPADMSKEEFELMEDPFKSDLYTIIRRDESGSLVSIWYHDFFNEKITVAADLLREAAGLAEDKDFEKYLNLRAEALLSDNYYESDIAWMKMKNNQVDFVVGPIETYEDQLFGYKAGHEAFILIKDPEWSLKLSRLASLLPDLQKGLPVHPKYKMENPGKGSDLNVYEVVYYSGDCNAGSKTIAINLPNDPKVRLNYGTRKLQLKNSIRYKFEKILVPISNVLITEDQRQYIDFDAFFENVMFHEVGHGLGITRTINGMGSVREALKDAYSPFSEGKADILSLYIIEKLADKGELGEKDLMTNYVTFLASMFRSVRFGASSAHGKANMMRFYYFEKEGAFTRDEETGTYRVNFEKMKEAVHSLANEILLIHGNGDYDKAISLIFETGTIREKLQEDLNRLNDMAIPVDLVFEQGPDVLGLD